MIARYLALLLLTVLSACSDFRETSFNCTGYLKEQTTILGNTIKKESNPKIIGVYVVETTKSPFNFWKEKTHSVSVGNMVFGNHESSISDFAFMGSVDIKKDGFGDEVSRQFFLDRKTNLIATTQKRARVNYENVERFEGVCNPVKQ